MKFTRGFLRLYAVTDRTWLHGKTLEQQVEDALQGGVTMLQLREKELSDADMIVEAVKLKAITARYGVPLIINDRVAVARASGADGVHLGQGDLDARKARAILGKDAIIGVTAKTPEQAQKAQRDGADYLGTGAVFGTSTKQDAVTITLSQLQAVCESVELPVVGIGGVSEQNMLQMKGSGVAGAAVVSAIFAKEDTKEAAVHLRALADQLVEAKAER